MRSFGIIGSTAIFGLLLSAVASAQLRATEDSPVIYGHHHINVSDLAAHRRFWVDTLGGTPVSLGNSEVVRFTNVLVFLREQNPDGGTKGTTVNHIGFTVPDLRATLDKLATAGYPDVTKAEVPTSFSVVDGIAYNEVQDTYLAFVMAPDDVKVELIGNPGQLTPPRLHHIHFATQDIAGMQAWYAKTLGAIPGMRGNFQAGDLPGVNLTYSSSDAPLAGTQGTSLDHIGFEVEGLEAFCEDLVRQGVEFDRPYTEIESLGIAIAFFTDPFGTYIELTEGLDTL